VDELAAAYLCAKRAVVDHGFSGEIRWQRTVGELAVTREGFVREAAWVVLSAGMRERVIRGLFGELTMAFEHFVPELVCRHELSVRRRALRHFNHPGKVDAILSIARRVAMMSGDEISSALVSSPEQFLQSLPFIGPVTWRHLAKNLGVPVPKPDRHLVRLAAATGRETVDRLCYEISSWVGEPVEVVDVVLWRWSVLQADVCPEQCHSGTTDFLKDRPLSALV
jgi:hypothetical protein